MRPEDLSDALNLLEDDLLRETDLTRGLPRRAPRRLALLAACLAVLALLIGRPGPDSAQDLPLLTITPDANGMGFEGYRAYDIEELVSANPWREENAPTRLPVFDNPCLPGEGEAAVQPDWETMETLARQTADALADETGEPVPAGQREGSRLVLEMEAVTVTVDMALTTEILFDPARPMPESCAPAGGAACDTMAAADWLRTEYAVLLAMEDPRPAIQGGEYDLSGQKGNYSLAFFEGAGSEEEVLLHYNLEQVEFAFDSEGALFRIRLHRPDLSHKLGDYPLITAREAEEMLLAGQYLTSVPYDMPGRAYVARVELLYRSESWQSCYMPYYRFYVELPQEAGENGMKCFGAYYVPAVEPRYMADGPGWDGGLF